MITNTEKINQSVKYYEYLIKKAEEELQTLPSTGYLRAYEHNNHFEYYLAETKQDKKPHYIPKKHQTLAKQLAQRDYDLKLLDACYQEKKELERALRTLQNQWEGKSAVKKLHMPPYTSPARSILITPHEITDEEFIEKWLAHKYTCNPYRAEDKIIITDKGDLVRSKSEKIMADKLFSLKIPYRYEAELYLPVTKKVVYPDFTVLRIADRTPIYIEHFGLLGDSKYRATAFNKMTTYGINGITSSNNAIFTFEDAENPFNSHHFELLLQSLNLT